MSYEHFLVKSSNSTFNMSIKETALQYILYLGGKKKGCVELFVDKETKNTRFAAFMDATVANMSSVAYNEQCSLEGMIAGEGTKNMVRTMFDILSKDSRFKHVKKVKLDDASFVHCRDTGWTISLAHLSIATNGSTWYEKCFHAQLKNPVVHQQYMSAKTVFHKPVAELPPFEFLFRCIQDQRHFEMLSKVYARSTDLNDFFTNARNEHGKDAFCEMTRSWLEPFVNDLLNGINVNTTWEIDLSKFKDLQALSITPLAQEPDYLQEGGFRKRPRKPTHTFDDLQCGVAPPRGAHIVAHPLAVINVS
jgi:hypothetical protein